MAKEDTKAPVEATAEPTVHPEGSVELGTEVGTNHVAHLKKDGSAVVITVITN